MHNKAALTTHSPGLHPPEGPAQSALALCLLTCCRKVPGAAVELGSPRGVPVMAAMLCGQRRLHQQVCLSRGGLGGELLVG